MKRTIKLVALSDAHWKIDYIEPVKCDILCYCGDWSGSGMMHEHTRLCSWLAKCDARYKLVVPGNHDMFCYKYEDLAKRMLLDVGAILLVDKEIDIYGLKVYGTPWCPRFGEWGYMRSNEDLTKIFGKIPLDTNILLTHTPPYGILDTAGTQHIGSKDLLSRIKKIRKLYHFFGHNHTPGYYKRAYRGRTEVERHFYNVSVCDNDYEIVAKPKELTFNIEYDIIDGENKLIKFEEINNGKPK